MTKFIDSFDFEIEELTKYIDFEDLEIISKDLTPGEIKEREAIDNKYKELLEKLKTELADLHPEGPPKNKYNIENYKEWKEYEKKGSKEWHDKRNELYNLTEDYKKQVDDFIIKVQERRFTEIIKSVGIKKFFQDRIKAAEAAINKAVNGNKDPKTKVYTDYGLNEIIKTYKEVIKTSKEVLDKLKTIDKNNIKDLSFSELLHEINIKTSMGDKEEIELLGEMKTIDNTITLVDKITYRLAAGVVPYKEIVPVKMEKGRSKKPITTYINLDIEEISDILPSNIGGEDINLLEAIISLLIGNIKNGINTFTLNDIYRVERRNLKVNPNKRIQEQLKNRILKLMKTLITIDSSEEKQAYYKNTDLFYKATSNLLNAHFLEVEVKGNKTMAIKILDIPLLYRYSEAKKQLTTIPFILTDNKLPKTSAVLILEKYLLRRISQMRNNNKLTRSILYSTIYDNMNFKHKSKSSIENAKAKTRINTEEILKQLIQTNYIKDYQIEKKGRNQYHRLKIIL